MLYRLLFMQKKWLSFLQTDHSLARFVITTGCRPKNLAAAVRYSQAFRAAPAVDSEFDLESAVFVFHMSGMQPESSGQRELRVL
jgi:hypothetical protein